MTSHLEVDRLIAYRELKSVFGVPYSRMHLWRLERASLFPKRIYLSANRTCWRTSEIIAWIEQKAAKRKPACVAGGV